MAHNYISARGLPANRESELRDCLEVIRAGQIALQMRDNVTIEECRAFARQAAWLSALAHERYRSNYPGKESES